MLYDVLIVYYSLVPMASSVPQNCITCSNRPDLSLKFRLLVAARSSVGGALDQQANGSWFNSHHDRARSNPSKTGLGGGGYENPTGN